MKRGYIDAFYIEKNVLFSDFCRLLVKVEHEELFTTAPIGSVLSRVNQNNLHTDPDISVKSILESREKLAYYDSISNFLEFEEYKACSVSTLLVK